MKRQNIIRLASFFAIIGLTLWGCASDSSDDVPSAYDSDSGMLIEGWSAYSSGDYEAALELFQEVGRRDALNTNAYLGQGWSSLRLESNIDARTAFGVVLNLAANEGDNTSMADGWAGLFLLELGERYNLETDPDEDPTEDDLIAAAEEALAAGEAVLSYDAAYTTTHDADFDYLEVHKALAQTYLYLHRYEETLEHTASYFETTMTDLLLGGDDFIIESVEDVTVVPYTDKTYAMQMFTIDEDLGIPISAELSGDVVILDLLYDLNGDSVTNVLSSVVDYLYDDNLMYFSSDYNFPTATETLPVYQVTHAQPGAASAPFQVAQTTGKGVFHLFSTEQVVWEDSVTWFIVDTTVTPPDTAVADDVYNPDPCCYFYSDTIQIRVLYDLAAAPWTSLDKDTGIPTDPDETDDNPDGVQIKYDYDLIEFIEPAGEPPVVTTGDSVQVTYSYVKYSMNYQKTDDFVAYLAYLNSKLSVGNSMFLVER